MKTRSIIALLGLFLLNSCIVKSLRPFYTQKTIAFDTRLIGEWGDKNKGSWKIVASRDEFEKDSLTGGIRIEDQRMYELFKDSYLIEYTSNNKFASFIGIPFKLGNQLFIDFMPIEYNNEKTNSLAGKHLIETHSLVKINQIADNTFHFAWFDEDHLKKLFKEKTIKLKHQQLGIDGEDFVLTASSEELQQFLIKYMKSENPEKWKTSTKYTLTKNYAKP